MLILPDFKSWDKATILKAMLLLVKVLNYKSTEQSKLSRKKKKNYRFLTKVKRQLNGKKIVFSINGAGIIGHSYAKTRLNTSLPSVTKVKSKWMSILNVKCKTIKFLEEIIDDLVIG